MIRLKFKIYAIFIRWCTRINFLFMGRQENVNNCDFLFNVSKKCHRRLMTKIARYDEWEMFVKMSFGTDWFVLHSFFCYHNPIVFSEFVFPYSLQLSWSFFYQWHHLQFLAQRIPTNQHPRILQLGRYIYAKIYLHENPITCASELNPSPTLSTNISIEWGLYLFCIVSCL